MKKPHAASVLRMLPAEKQRELFEYLQRHSQVEGITWLAAQGIRAGTSQLSRFWQWYPLAVSLRATCDASETLKEILREMPELNLDEQQLCRAAQAIFEAQALQGRDSALFLSLKKARQRDRALDLEMEHKRNQAQQAERALALAERRVAALEAQAVVGKEAVKESGLSPEERASRIRQIFEWDERYAGTSVCPPSAAGASGSHQPTYGPPPRLGAPINGLDQIVRK